jgi:hypothetical protein
MCNFYVVQDLPQMPPLLRVWNCSGSIRCTNAGTGLAVSNVVQMCRRIGHGHKNIWRMGSMTRRSTDVKHKLVNSLLFFRYISALLHSREASGVGRGWPSGLLHGVLSRDHVLLPSDIPPLASSTAIGEPKILPSPERSRASHVCVHTGTSTTPSK